MFFRERDELLAREILAGVVQASEQLACAAEAPDELPARFEARLQIGVFGRDPVELLARDDREITDRHPLGEAGHERPVARDDEKGPALRVIEREGDAGSALRDPRSLEQETKELVVAVEIERHLHLRGGDPIETREEVVLVGHGLRARARIGEKITFCRGCRFHRCPAPPRPDTVA